MEEIYSFGYWVMRRRKALDLTRADLAQRVSCSAETIKKIERDERRPSRQVAELLALALAVPENKRELFLEVARGERPVDSLSLLERPISPSPISHSLPPQTTPFVGREAELEALATYLADPAIRLVTILGPGGMGKTRLALAAAEAQLRDTGHPFPHGVFFVALAPLGSPDQLLPAIAEALDFRFDPGGEPKEQMLNYLRHKRLLLVLDNFEHLRAGAGLVNEMLAAAPGLKVLVTSRERLNRQVEQLFVLGGLNLPDPTADGGDPSNLTSYGAIQLFVQSARRNRPIFELTLENQPHVIEICRLVGGAPLGIVLAASWLGALPVTEIATEMRDDLDFLAVEMGDVPERQRSLRAAFNHSWRLLAEPEQAIFGRLSVFRGGFDRHAAMAVADASPRDLQALVNKSLLVRYGDRYEVHELLRQFAAEKLAGSPEEEAAARETHSAYFCDLLRELKDDWHNARQLEALKTVTREADNIRPALQWALVQESWPRLSQAIDSWATYLLHWQGDVVEGINLCQAITRTIELQERGGAAVSPDYLRLWAVTLAWMSLFAGEIADFKSETDSAELSLELLDRPEIKGLDIRREKAFAYLVSSSGQVKKHSWRQNLEQALELCQELGERSMAADILIEQAYTDWMGGGRLVSGLEKLQRAYDIQLEIEDRRAQVHSLTDIALIKKNLGRLTEAEKIQRELIHLTYDLGLRSELPDLYINLGFTQIWCGQFEEAIPTVEKGLTIAMNQGQHRDTWANNAICQAMIHAGQFEEARRRFEKFSDVLERAVPRPDAGATLGMLAMAEGNFVKGETLLSKSIAILRANTLHLVGFWLGELAMANIHLNKIPCAKEHITEKLASARANENFMSVVFALPAAALLLANSGDVVRAVEIWALAQRMPIMANSRYYEDLAWREVAAAAGSLPPDVLAAARERGRALELWATAGELLTWLESQA